MTRTDLACYAAGAVAARQFAEPLGAAAAFLMGRPVDGLRFAIELAEAVVLSAALYAIARALHPRGQPQPSGRGAGGATPAPEAGKM